MKDKKPTLTTKNSQKAPPTAGDLLMRAAAIQEERAEQYDSEDGERSMGRAVAMFNIATRRDGTEMALRESDGWLLIQYLKDVRDQSTQKPHQDSLEDKVSYAALHAEARLAGR